MRKILLTVAYEGSGFHGFAYQDGVRTVEGALADAVRAACGHEAVITGASRTDAGVHAYGNLASFDTDSTIPAEKFAAALNTKLPQDVRVVCAKEVAPDFHPRKTGWKKTYEYRILNAELPDPMLGRYTYHYRAPLDVHAMGQAAKALVGEHDFTSFCSVHSLSETRVRTIYDCLVLTRDAYPADLFPAGCGQDRDARQQAQLVVIRVSGSGFLYHMVRIIAGTLLDVGRGRLSAEDIPRILEARDRSAAGATLDAQGLFLLGYEKNDVHNDSV